MDAEEMKVYIETLEKENAILKERNDKLYEMNCNQARMISNSLGYDMRGYENIVIHDNFNSATRVYNQVMCKGSATVAFGINYI